MAESWKELPDEEKIIYRRRSQELHNKSIGTIVI
jgi:hypothetical protein